jgi:hypothetical protein
MKQNLLLIAITVITGFGFITSSDLSSKLKKNKSTETFKGKFINGSCADNACDCKSCLYTFKDAKGNEMSFDEIDSKIKIQLLVSDGEGGTIPNRKYLKHEFSITYETIECGCLDPADYKVKITKITSIKMLK